MPQSPSPARRAAVDLLDQVLTEQRALTDRGPATDALVAADRAAAYRLADASLRGLERADRLLKPHLRKRPPPRVMNILRLGVTEICAGGAAHGVVNDCVAIAAARPRTAGLRGMVNAVLRKITDDGPEEWANLRPPRLPNWLRKPLVAAWDAPAVGAMEAGFVQPPPLDLTCKTDAEAVAKMTGGTLLPTGSVRLHAPGQITALPGYDSGDWWVQDAAAALPVRLLGDVRDLRALDMCAAPGGKTMQLAAAGALVTALDLSQSRLKRIEENLQRTGLYANCLAEDALTHKGQYDIILLDAPCSATGTLRRHPDLPHLHSGERIGELIDQQSAMLDHALSLLAPGGRLVFATCSLLPDEGECHIDALLERTTDIRAVPLDAPWIEDIWRSSEGGLRLRPDFWADRGGMDGFYMAVVTQGGSA